MHTQKLCLLERSSSFTPPPHPRLWVWGTWFSIDYHTNFQVPLVPINMYLWWISKPSGSSGPGSPPTSLLNLLTSPTSSFLFTPNPPFLLLRHSCGSCQSATLSLLAVTMTALDFPKCLWLFPLPFKRYPAQFHIHNKPSF